MPVLRIACWLLRFIESRRRASARRDLHQHVLRRANTEALSEPRGSEGGVESQSHSNRVRGVEVKIPTWVFPFNLLHEIAVLRAEIEQLRAKSRSIRVRPYSLGRQMRIDARRNEEAARQQFEAHCEKLKRDAEQKEGGRDGA